ncbi:MAG: hypothetical protein Q7T51_00835 [Candidatus Moranbacteria bacterium]|nr:hypothetical protein [Candidatus Moranbacteria bacterium]
MTQEICGVMFGGILVSLPHFYSRMWELIRQYKPELDSEIREMLAIMEKEERDISRRQGYTERLSSYWKMKIQFILNEVWSRIRDGQLSEQDRQEAVLILDAVDGLINLAKEEVKSSWSWQGAGGFFQDNDFRYFIETLRSFLENPPEEGVARIFSEYPNEDSGTREVSEIAIEDQLDPDIIMIPALPIIDDDDLMGQQLRAADLIGGCGGGRIIVNGWNLPIIELENGEVGVPIDKMLAEFGGCPKGLVFNGIHSGIDMGYSLQERACWHCCQRTFCPGGELLRAWSLPGLARKLRLAWMHRNNIQLAIPLFDSKMLESK